MSSCIVCCRKCDEDEDELDVDMDMDSDIDPSSSPRPSTPSSPVPCSQPQTTVADPASQTLNLSTKPCAPPADVPRHPSTVPSGFRPGRLSHLEILERIFPGQKKNVLELVLQGCNGDLVKAIEHFLSAQDTIQQQIQQKDPPAPTSQPSLPSPQSPPQAQTSPTRHPGTEATLPTSNGFNPYLAAAFSPFKPPVTASLDKPQPGNVKSAFTPLTPSPYPAIHSAFAPRSFTADMLLARAPFLPPPRPGEPPLPHPGFPFPSAHVTGHWVRPATVHDPIQAVLSRSPCSTRRSTGPRG